MKLLTLKIDRIIANSNQPRKYFDKDKMFELKESIKNNGLLQPITVRKISGGKYEIIAGERRYRACRELGMENIPAIEINTGDARGYELSVLENVQREDLNPIEEAESYLMLMEVYGYTQEKLSEKLGKNRSSLSNKIRILKLPGNVKELVKKRELSYGHARTLLALSDEKQIIELAKEVIEKKYSVRETEKKVKIILEKNTFSNFSFSNILSDKRRKMENRDTHLEKFSEKENETNKESYKEQDAEKVFLENKLREFFESSVEIKGNLHENGKIEIKFHDYEELERIIELLNIDFD